MKKYLLVVMLYIPVICFGQHSISGTVINAADQKPIADASVFLSNSAIGSKTGMMANSY